MSDSAHQRPTSKNGKPSIDEMIEWLGTIREKHSDRPLVDLISQSFCGPKQSPEDLLSSAHLVDLICIDLIQQWRAGQRTSVENYIKQFPSLDTSPESKLDLIDAEICIRRETSGQQNTRDEIADFKKRFPELADEIAELVNISLTGGPDPLILDCHQNLESGKPSAPSEGTIVDGTLVLSPDGTAVENATNTLIVEESETGDPELGFSYNESKLSPQPITSFDKPIDTPEWFVGEQCIASSPGRWLVRGRDSDRGETLVMKVIEMPVQACEDAEQILDLCELASKVKNPAWVPPSVAASQNRNLAVIRRWQFGNPWQPLSDPSQIPIRLRQLSTVAYALQSAHRIGAVHGGVHPGNILIDHADHVFLVDACASYQSVVQWLGHPSSVKTAPSNRWRTDAQGLIKLVMTETIDAPGEWSNRLHDSLQEIVQEHETESCGVIGDELVRRSDAISSQNECTEASKPSWRKRLSRWLDPA